VGKHLVVSMISRRVFLSAFAALSVVPAQAAAEHPSMGYMRKVGKDLLNAHRQGTVSAFMRAIQRHADIPGIGDYSLGEYGSKLSAGERQKYYRGVTTFISRYFAEQSRDYPIAKYELGDARVDGEKNITIISKVYLLSGQVYDVKWRLVWRGGRYRVSDARMLGFSLTYLQRNLFTSFIEKRNGDVSKLVAALNP
jgi:phospholipid transport system substrate-binding protein